MTLSEAHWTRCCNLLPPPAPDGDYYLPLLLSDGHASYIYGPGGMPIEHISSGEAPTYYHHDQLGSTRMLTNSTGTFTYEAYGSQAGSSGTQTTPLGYTGQYTNAESVAVSVGASV